ncbi:type II and III secretion system protein, partial [bacterium AH-315-J21]|nr:type II and III secretion system protein [bacterium AH-315-J21]
NLGKLTDKFFVRLSALSNEGKAKVIQRPQIATLNGHTASIAIGTTQYFLLDSKTVYPSAQTDVSTQTSQRFETIEANISLEVTPNVTESGEVIVHIKPEFSTPAGQGFDPDIPPTINKRVIESTVRLRNGETIVLGGIVNSTESVTINKLPILGDIPLLGRLFQNRSSTKNETELMIYITPHIYYGSEGAIDIEEVLH